MTRTRRMTFPGAGGETLAGRLELPEGTPRAVALFAHCFTCGKDAVAATRVAHGLTDRGIAVLRFDFTGLGQSGGDFGNTTFSSNIGDLVRAADHLRATLAAPTILIGHSLGGAAVLAAAHRIPETRAIVTIGAPADPAHIRHLFADAAEEIRTEGAAEVRLAGRTFMISREFLTDIAEQPQRERIATLGVPLLVLHAPLDEIVDVDNARKIFAAARHPKSFLALDGADHLLTRPADSAYVAEVVAAWASRYLPTPGEEPDPAEALEAGTPPGTVVVSETGSGRFTQRVTAGPHALTADEPVSVGGDDAGPNPYDLLLAALGACTSMTLRMYAQRKGWPLRDVSVTLRHSRIHADDCADCETREGMLDHVERAIGIEGDLDPAQRARLMEIADKCPVHRTLRSEVVIHTHPASTPLVDDPSG